MNRNLSRNVLFVGDTPECAPALLPTGNDDVEADIFASLVGFTSGAGFGKIIPNFVPIFARSISLEYGPAAEPAVDLVSPSAGGRSWYKCAT